MSIIVDSSTSHLPEIKSFVEAVRQYCKMIESIDNQKELCIFLRQVAASIAHLYTCAFDLPKFHCSTNLPKSFLNLANMKSPYHLYSVVTIFIIYLWRL